SSSHRHLVGISVPARMFRGSREAHAPAMQESVTSGEEIRAAQRALWNEFASGWEKWDAVVQTINGPVGDAMIASLTLRSDQQHLDVAAGTGDPGLMIATQVPNGRVVITDLAPEMLAAAQRRADTKGLRNVDFEECSVDTLPFADNSFDSAS